MAVTMSANRNTVTPQWFLVDAEGAVLGRLATRIACVLRGKHKPIYTPHCDTGDYVVVINADQLVLTGQKADRTRHHWHTGYPGGIKDASLSELMNKNSAEVLRRAIRRMLPKGPLGRDMLRKVRIYHAAEHPHAAQQLSTVWPYANEFKSKDNS
ncbi:MAG: 50S ribosomal protein L13 [Legionellales bacterium]|nr:50S ribosomal protein L13 [Legionellales bacterium]